jgi:hypothetical protein
MRTTWKWGTDSSNSACGSASHTARATLANFGLGFNHFKAFYGYGIGQQYRACFGDLPHYDRFVSLMPRLFAPLMVLRAPPHCTRRGHGSSPSI